MPLQTDLFKKDYWTNEPETEEFPQKSDTLVLHPIDRSTTFLAPIYSGKGYDVLNSYKGDVNALLPRYDRIIMMGHGLPPGLFSVGKFKGSFAIDAKSVPGLKGKSNVYIWCFASEFVSDHGLKGFSTGMFISEVGEASWALGYKAAEKVTQKEVTYSNNLFAKVMSGCIASPSLQHVISEYDGDSPVIQYNRSVMKQF